MAIFHPEKIGIDSWFWSYAAGTGPHGIDNWGGDSQSPDADPTTHWTPAETLLNGLNAIGFKWYYTAEPHPLPANVGGSEAINPNPGAINWYPAIRSPAWQSGPQLARVAADPDLCIGYNEPWAGFAGPLTPTQALDGYAALQALPNRLSAPSISSSTPSSADWLATFMAGVVSRGYRIDAINLHYYSADPSMALFQAYIDQFHSLYNKPIIVTEWALADWNQPNGTTATFTQQAAFAEAGCTLMDGLSYVEAHAWFGQTEGGGAYLNSGAMNQDGSMTIVGQAFHNLILGAVVPPVLARGKSTATANNLLNLLFNQTNWPNVADNAASSPLTNLYIALHTADPGRAGLQTTSEVAYTGYARRSVARTTGGWTASTAGITSPVADITFPISAGGGNVLITHWSIGVASGGATAFFYSGTVTPNIQVGTGVTPVITAGSTVSEG